MARVNETLKRMELEDDTGATLNALSEMLLPSMFRAKIDHPMLEYWKTTSESKKENWEEVQLSFLKESKKFRGNHDISEKFCSANQRSDSSNKLNGKDKRVFEKALKEGRGVPQRIWQKMSATERDRLKAAKKVKYQSKSKNNNGRLGLQYLSLIHI